MITNIFKQSLVILAILTLVLFTQSSCKKDSNIIEPTGQDYIVFGDIYGLCVGDCRTLFKITSDGVYEDAGQMGPIQDTEFQSTPMSDEDFSEASRLWELPESLINNQVPQSDLLQIIADYDFYIMGSIDGSEFQITYDEIDENSNEELYDYSQIVSEVMENLR